MKKIIISLLGMLFLLCNGAFAADYPMPTGIIIGGDAVLEKEPDQTKIQFTIYTIGKTSEAAQTQNARVSSAVYQSFLAGGIDRNSWKTVQIDLSPRYEYEDSKQKLVGYQMTHRVLVTLSGTDRAGQVVKSLVDSGVETIDFIRFGLKDPKGAQKEALAAATKDAKVKAEIMAEAAGATIKGVRYIGEPEVYYQENATHSQVNRYRDDAGGMEQQVWAGSVSVVARVRIEFDLVK